MAEIPTTFLSENGILTRLDGSKGDEEKEGRSGEVDSRDGRICDLMRLLGGLDSFPSVDIREVAHDVARTVVGLGIM